MATLVCSTWQVMIPFVVTSCFRNTGLQVQLGKLKITFTSLRIRKWSVHWNDSDLSFGWWVSDGQTLYTVNILAVKNVEFSHKLYLNETQRSKQPSEVNQRKNCYIKSVQCGHLTLAVAVICKHHYGLQMEVSLAPLSPWGPKVYSR